MDSIGSQQNNGHLQPHEVTDSDHAPATTTISTLVLLSHPIQIVVGLLQVFTQALLHFAHIPKIVFYLCRTKVTNHRLYAHISPSRTPQPHRASNHGRTRRKQYSYNFILSLCGFFFIVFSFFKALRFGCCHLFRIFILHVRLTGSKFMVFCSVLMTCLNG